MSRNATPGFSIAAQMREARAALRRTLRKRIERLETQRASLDSELNQAKEELRQLELQRNGRAILGRAADAAAKK